MKISTKIRNEDTGRPCSSTFDYDIGFNAGVKKAAEIAKAHEAEYGWQPIATAPEGRRIFARCDRVPEGYFAFYSSTRHQWEGQRGITRLIPTEWHSFEEEEK